MGQDNKIPDIFIIMECEEIKKKMARKLIRVIGDYDKVSHLYNYDKYEVYKCADGKITRVKKYGDGIQTKKKKVDLDGYPRKMSFKVAILWVIEHCELPVEVEQKLIHYVNVVNRVKRATRREQQARNEVIKQSILKRMKPNKGYTAEEIYLMTPELSGTSLQKARRVMGMLVDDGKAARHKIDNKMYYSL